MKTYGCGAVLLIALWGISGCGGDTIQGTAPKDPAADYAREIKQQVTDYVNSAKADSETAVEEAGVLLEELEVAESKSGGQHTDVYAQLLQKCQEIAGLKDTSGLGGKLDELQEIANKLPGEVSDEDADGEAVDDAS